MGYCKECFDHLSNDCILTNGVCVFCHYKTKTWDSNGRLVSKKEALESLEKGLVWRGYLQRYVRDLAKAIKRSSGGVVKNRMKMKLVKTEQFLKSWQSKKFASAQIIAINLKRIRGAKGISQSILARKAGLSRSTCSRVENGKANPKVSDLQRIADILEVNISRLVTPVPPIKSLRFRLACKE